MKYSDSIPRRSRIALVVVLASFTMALANAKPARANDLEASNNPDPIFRSLLDAPLLFVKRHSYTGIHIYDTFYKWPGGKRETTGGIYILENPSAPRENWTIRTVIDGTTEGTLGNGVYTHPDISFDCKKIVFCYKGTPDGCTMIYQIDIDGKNLRRLTDPTSCLPDYKGVKNGMHDISPTYLPDGRIVFLSTRPRGLVPCANEGVSILHTMNGDGSNIHPISVNSETEFDPMILPDGRIIYGRWEYIDKNALTIQSLWTVYPDGTNETAMYGNNMVFPEAILDPRPVPNSNLIAVTLAKHNASPRGTVGMIDPFIGKNGPAAIFNFENKTDPTFDLGNSCEPYPLSEEVLIYSGRPEGAKRNAIMMINRKGQKITLLSDPGICLHAPILVKPRSARLMPEMTDRSKTTGYFYVQNVYDGLHGIKKGEAKWLRVVEESSRVSHSPGSNIFNQTFSISAALAFSAKIYHGMVPISEDGSVYFEAPSGRAIFFQVLDKDKRLIQSMRTFIQAAPGTTRSCIGCHENKSNAPISIPIINAMALKKKPSVCQPESWGTGYMDYPSLIQPIWDKHCVSCHGGKKGFANRLDLTGGWTDFFNNSYENLADRRETQLIAHYISGIDCMNGTAHYSSPLFGPRSIGSAVAPLARVIMSGHKGRIKGLTTRQRDLIMAWIDSNGLYFGSWDYTRFGPRLNAWGQARKKLEQTMTKAGCYRCHDNHFAGDWVNLETPEYSRILRAPLAKGGKGMGQAICQNHKMDPARNRIRLLRHGGYQHAVQPLSFYAKESMPPINDDGAPQPTFASSSDPLWQEMLTIIRDARTVALAAPRVDMPGAEVISGQSRMMVPPPVPKQPPALTAHADKMGIVHLQWTPSALTIGLISEIHRSSEKEFTPNERTLIAHTELFGITDKTPPAGIQYYALQLLDEYGNRSGLSRTQVQVKMPPPPMPPT
ncbi:MAG: hypothetical protein K9M57_09810, partial [Phycisphaerae bacterium]|nr:hypothetical protein [Phycisphaerae bacterium]